MTEQSVMINWNCDCADVQIYFWLVESYGLYKAKYKQSNLRLQTIVLVARNMMVKARNLCK